LNLKFLILSSLAILLCLPNGASVLLTAIAAEQPVADSESAPLASQASDSSKQPDSASQLQKMPAVPTQASDKSGAASAKVPGGKPGGSATAKAKQKRRGNAPCLAWIDPDVPPRAVVLCVHGLGLHNGTYEDFGKRMAHEGVATYAIDVRGFGSWMEAKGRERVDFDGCLEDMKSTLKVIHRAHPGLPVFVLGESMGGAIALRTAALYPTELAGLISSVPAGDRFQQKKTALKVALHLLEGPNKEFNVGQGVINQATQKKELRDAWCNDPLARMNLSPRELIQFQGFMNQNHEIAKEIKNTPVLIVQGCNDRLVRPEGTVELYNELATPDKQLELIHNAEHLVFEEKQFTDDDIKLVTTWIDKHLPAKKDAVEATN
jgi:alpha-beta hydrolase superfamily lysophospholipase